MNNISQHISYGEAVHSDTAKRLGIQNVPDETHLVSMRIVAEKIFEPLRVHFGVPIYISSFFRALELNNAIGGATNSQHMKGEAIDIDAEVFGKVTNKQVFDYIKGNLNFDQLIYEGIRSDGSADWVHVSYINEIVNRKQVLSMKMVGNLKVYEIIG
jgi:zinc D-Ala-D-Ala carboxypeptidase